MESLSSEPKAIGGTASFNGVSAIYMLLLSKGRFERKIEFADTCLWDAFDGDSYWQCDFGGPICRRQSPFSVEEGSSWLRILHAFIEGQEGTFTVPSIAGKTFLTLANGVMTTGSSAGNRLEYKTPHLVDAAYETLKPKESRRLEFELKFDSALGIPRTQIGLNGRLLQVMLDTGADTSVFVDSVEHDELPVRVQVAVPGGHVEMQLGRIRDIGIADASIEELTCFFIPVDKLPKAMRYFKGIVGQDIIGRSAVSFDYKNSKIIARRESDRLLTWPLDGAYTKAVVDGVNGWHRIDTGSQFTFHKFVQQSDRVGSATAHAGIGGGLRSRPLKVAAVAVDSAKLSDIRGYTVHVDESDGISGNIGAALLRQLDFTIDVGRGLCRFGNKVD